MREVGTQRDKLYEMLEALVQGRKIVWLANPPDVSKA